MKILLDTNLLLRLDDQAHPMHAEAVAAVDWLDVHRHDPVLIPQVLYEYWVVATRPINVNGLGVSVDHAHEAIMEWTSLFELLLEERVFPEWNALVFRHQVKGKLAHDTRLVASMQKNKITTLLTFNKPDFARFTTINVYSPNDVLAGRLP